MSERLAANRLVLVGLLLLAAVLGAALLLGAQRLLPGTPGGDRAQIERIVHDYVLENPEILPEAMARLQQRETGEAIAANRDAIFTPVGNAWAGNPDGDLTIAEYFDYNCGYCRASLPTIDRLLASDPKLRIVYHELPVLSAESGVAAKLSLAAAKAGKFHRFHQALYAGGPLTEESMSNAARHAGLDPAKLEDAAQAPEIEQAISANLSLSGQLRMSGTPTWVIGNQVVSSALPLDQMKTLIARARHER